MSQQFPHHHCIWNVPAVWHPQAPRQGYVVLRFRRTFALASDQTAVLWVSAAERFILHLDGEIVARGPARSDTTRWNCSGVPVRLRAGRHVLAATVWFYGQYGPLAQGGRAGFFLLGAAQPDGRAHSALSALVNTGPQWRCVVDEARTPMEHAWGEVNTFDVTGWGERIDARRLPWGFERPDFDDSSWAQTRELARPGLGLYGVTPLGHWLVPSPLPPMDEVPGRFERACDCEGVALRAVEAFLRGGSALRVPPQRRFRVVLDRGELTNSYPLLTVSGGAGAVVRLVTVEAPIASMPFNKGNRDLIEGKHLWGHADEFLPDGGEGRTFSTLWWRSFRYVELTITTADAPLELVDFSLLMSGYPLRQRARFMAAGAMREPSRWIWDTSWRTARLCAHETYFDCPHYEQLQYVGDTRIQALYSYLLANDDRLARKAIDDFHANRTNDGLLHSRGPTSKSNMAPPLDGKEAQVIPSFSLYWIAMLDDFRQYRGDADFVRQYLPVARGVLEWFARRLRDDGVLGHVGYWPFMDWVKGYPAGNAPQDADGGSTIYTLLWAIACGQMAQLETWCGQPELAGRWRRMRRDAVRNTLQAAWDKRRGLVADVATRDNADRTFSVHAQVHAVLAGAWRARQSIGVLDRAMSAPNVTQPGSLYFRFYVMQALKAAGRAKALFDLLPRWLAFRELGLSTWPENDEPSRSDCHAWSVMPAIEFLRVVLGVEPHPQAQGFDTIVFAPELGPLPGAKGAVPTPHGVVRVDVRRQGARQHATIVSPVPVVLPGTRPKTLRPGKHELLLP
jgi:hypothetical protein